jgi:hypothetical protein
MMVAFGMMLVGLGCFGAGFLVATVRTPRLLSRMSIEELTALGRRVGALRKRRQIHA